ncbi:unnamed protein product [Ceratitis capitata]|uniref:(Mediterranean fruit fly) hypothetical protein n=1 Tax=Ceratitis capitata TaxID=7213 RepID=A0A811V1Q5_CERCA|nr:unnamed protein product [Ceratitis capitata]
MAYLELSVLVFGGGDYSDGALRLQLVLVVGASVIAVKSIATINALRSLQHDTNDRQTHNQPQTQPRKPFQPSSHSTVWRLTRNGRALKSPHFRALAAGCHMIPSCELS